MNPYRLFIHILRILLSLFVVLTLLAVLIPVFSFHNKAVSNTDVIIFDEATSQTDGREWVMKHDKAKRLSEEKADVLVVATGQDFEKRMDDQIDHNVIVMEMLFNQFDMNSKNAEKLGTISNLHYSGFIGKTFPDLGKIDLIPKDWINRYESLYSKKWTFSGEGMIFYSAQAVIVLKKGSDYEGVLTLKEGATSVPYRGYFEIVSSEQEPLAVLDLDVTEEGEKRLGVYGIGNEFPALVQSVKPLFTSYYFALDLGSQRVDVPSNYDYMPYLMGHKLIYDSATDEKAFWKWYYPKLSGILDSRHTHAWKAGNLSERPSFGVKGTQIVYNDINGSTKPYFIKGINLGSALPATTFTEFPRDKGIYLNWFSQMKALNINTVRVYTLMPPEFYEALHDVNKDQVEPIYLLQEIWPEEHPVDANYLDETYNAVYRNEIQWTVSALHGDVAIPERLYRAYGLYQFDVSEYVLGYLVGREMEPEEVRETDRLNREYRFKGEYFYSEAMATPTEAWLAGACDYVLQIENEKYGDNPLVAIVSWPTLDPLSHDSEWNSSGDKSLQYNDSSTVDIGHIGTNESKVSGFFGAYHIYPNYPDFMNLDPEYADYRDEQGEFRYGGYLKAFMEQHTRYPAVVAEYGISTSMYTAHYSPNGMNHGGLSEIAQGEDVVRMTKAILDEGYSGAVIFEWMDEWAKKTWITEPFMIPYNRHALWHNVLDPEQGYGLLSYDPSEPSMLEANANLDGVDQLMRIQHAQNEAYLILDLEFKDSNSVNQPFQLALSTTSERQGKDLWEFLIVVDQEAEIRVNPGYNWTSGRYSPVDVPFENYEKMTMLINKENTTKNGLYTPGFSLDLSTLNKGGLTIPQNHLQVEGNHMTLRIPYGLIGISDPSSLQVLSDDKTGIPTSQDGIGTKISPNVRYKLMMDGKSVTFDQDLIGWEMPNYNARLKNGVKMISDYFKTLP